MFIGLGTLANVVTVTVGSLIGLGLGHRFSDRVRTTVTHVLGLFTMVIAAQSIVAMGSQALRDRVGSGAPTLIVLGALLLGSILGSALRIEDRLDSGAAWVRARFAPRSSNENFVNGLITATLVFCVGPLTIVGSLTDGLGRGADQLLVKAVLDGFSSIAFAASLGGGVLAAAGAVAIIQGSLTLLGFLIGDVLPPADIDALTAAGGVLLLGLGFRLTGIKQMRVADMLPALLLAPLLVELVALFR